MRPDSQAGGELGAQERTISAVVSRNFRGGMPIAVAGTMPKFDSTEYRPPIDFKPWKTWRKPAAVAIFSTCEFGSVTVTKRLAASASLPSACFAFSKKYALKMFGSKVLPDLLETMKRVFLRSTALSKRLTCAGSVESST